MSDAPLYQVAIMLLLISGLIPALIFLGQHRPKQWKRLIAWDASGLVVVAALWYVRSIVLLAMRWPGTPPRGTFDAAWSILMLLIIDALLIVRLVSYRSFVEADERARPHEREHRKTELP